MSDFQLTALGQIVWEDRYGLKDENGNLIEKNILETFRRVAKAMASKEKDSALWEERFYDIMANKYFCPAGRILAHAGTPHSQLLNCFVLPFEDDSLEAIMETAKNMAITQKFSGGTGFNYSNLRPSGAHIKGVNGRSCGVLGFMNMMSTVSEVIEQGGCFVSDTYIATPLGAKKITDLKENELVYTLSENGFILQTCSKAWKTYQDASVWKVITNKGLELFVTENHPFMPKNFDFSNKNYIQVKDLAVDQNLKSFIQDETKVASIEFSHRAPVYNIEVKETHNFIVCNSLMTMGVVVSNSRRGANLGLLEVSHPDIWEYISYKTEHNWDHLREFVDIKDEEKWTAFKFENLYKLQMYNISVGITDEFLDAVKKDTYWPLLWKDKEWELYTVRFKKSIGNELFKTSDLEVVADCEKTAFWKVKKKIPYPGAKDIFEVVSKRKIKASEIWNKICYNAWADGCPGLINLSTARKYHNLEYVHPVLSTNPCMTGETMVAVADGRVAVSIKQLAEEDKDIPVYCRNDKGRATIRMMRHPRITGYNQKILKVTIEGGHVLRVNETHKFTSSEGSTIVAKNLKAGDSLSIMSRLQAPFDYIVKNSNSKSQDYYWINSTEKKSWVPEHRLIYNFNHREGLFFKEVIHHRDFNGLNNAIGNLQLCSKKEYDTLHSINMFGNKNPMRRAQTEWSEEKWQQYRDNMSASVAGELNGRFSGISNEKLFEKAIEISKKYGKKLTTDEWEEYAKKEGYPSQFSQYRTDTFGTVCEFLDKAATTAQVPGAGLMNSVLSAFNDYLKIKDNTDLNIFFDEKAEIDFVKVRKICEGCKKEFIIPYYRREQGFCSKTCAGKNYVLSPDGKTKLLQAKEELRDKKRLQQINAFNDLKFKLGYLPMKKEYTVYCKENKIPFRLPVKREVAKGILIGTFHSWKELTEEALTHNHRVLSIEEDGFENVYNGTVDEYHNFYIGHFKENIDGHCKFIYVNNLQCGEQPIAKNSSCNLSSIVLPSLYNKDTNSIDYPKLKEIVHTAIRFSDNVIDNCIFPIPEIKKVALEERRIGLGTMGVHDLLIKMKLGYDSPEGRDVINELLRTIRDEAYKASIEIAEEKGAFPLFNKEKFTEGAFIKTLSPTIRKSIFTNGIRNGALTSQAPTGSTGTMYNCSTGCEPWFALSFQRNTRLGSYEDGCPDYIKWKNENPDKPKPSYFKTSQEISSEDHIKMMALFSKYICSAVSKTVNLPNSASVEDVKKAFEFAMEQGAKGITIFRDGSKEGVLVNKDKEKVIEDAKESVRELQSLEKATTEDSRAFPIQRGNIADGSTYRIPLQHHNLYVTVNKNDDGKLVEVFAVAGKSKRAKDVKYNGVENSWAEALGRLASLCLRAGVDPCSIISNLKNITSDKPVFGTIGRNENSELIPSPPHAIARVMEEALNRDKPKKVTCNQEPEKIETKNKFCTECGSSEITMKGPNCYECHSCGYSGCGG